MNAEGDDDKFGVLSVAFLPLLLLGADGLILGAQVLVHDVAVRVGIAAGDERALGMILGARIGPRGSIVFRRIIMIFRQNRRFRGLGGHAVEHEKNRSAVGVGKPDPLRDEIHDFLTVGRCEHRHMVVAMPAAAGGHVVIALRTQNITVARAHTHGVEHQAGQFGTAHEGNGFLHERHAGPGTGSRTQHARTGRARQGAGNGELAFHLQHLAAVLRQDDGHTLHDVGRGGNRVGKMKFNTTTRQTFRECFRVF